MSQIFFSVYFEFYVVVIPRKLEWWYMVFYLLPKEIDFPRFKYSRFKILSNGNFNYACLLLSFLFSLYSYLKGGSLKTK